MVPILRIWEIPPTTQISGWTMSAPPPEGRLRMVKFIDQIKGELGAARRGTAAAGADLRQDNEGRHNDHGRTEHQGPAGVGGPALPARDPATCGDSLGAPRLPGRRRSLASEGEGPQDSCVVKGAFAAGDHFLEKGRDCFA